MYSKAAKEVRSERQKLILEGLITRDQELEAEVNMFRRLFPLVVPWDTHNQEAVDEQQRLEEMIQMN
jgi:hypothetical protein